MDECDTGELEDFGQYLDGLEKTVTAAREALGLALGTRTEANYPEGTDLAATGMALVSEAYGAFSGLTDPGQIEWMTDTLFNVKEIIRRKLQ